MGIALHEIGHMLGLWHEHTRNDRDNNVIIRWKNIRSNKLDNFDKVNKGDEDNLGLPYDYTSIMHYAKRVSQHCDTSRLCDTIMP